MNPCSQRFVGLTDVTDETDKRQVPLIKAPHFVFFLQRIHVKFEFIKETKKSCILALTSNDIIRRNESCDLNKTQSLFFWRRGHVILKNNEIMWLKQSAELMDKIESKGGNWMNLSRLKRVRRRRRDRQQMMASGAKLSDKNFQSEADDFDFFMVLQRSGQLKATRISDESQFFDSPFNLHSCCVVTRKSANNWQSLITSELKVSVINLKVEINFQSWTISMI